MRRLIGSIVLAFVVAMCAVPAFADSDGVARSRIRKLQVTVEELETKVVALQLQIAQLSAANEKLETQSKANYALIQAMAKRLPVHQ